MDDNNGYAVYFFPPALEALGDAIKPYLVEGPNGAHVLCREIDTGGSLIEMTLDGRGSGEPAQVELMVPGNMVRMIVSARTDESFGFGPRIAPAPAAVAASSVIAAKASPPDAIRLDPDAPDVVGDAGPAATTL
ncbi:MAG: hypothetical protein H0W24_11350 [Lysobacter sp.]|nr:hypothetical protein [Lysobacter sp.]MDQ3270187.1 hypothetical protein [Pseudomonadota bacterium]